MQATKQNWRNYPTYKTRPKEQLARRQHLLELLFRQEVVHRGQSACPRRGRWRPQRGRRDRVLTARYVKASRDDPYEETSMI
jgi:hypothetical protein